MACILPATNSDIATDSWGLGVHKVIGQLIVVITLLAAFEVKATPIYYSTRAEFMAAVGSSITDDYTTYTPGVFSNVVMSEVFGETNYESLTFSNQNQVIDGTGFIDGDGSAYCSGCNGNFMLGFASTSLSENGGLFGVGLDIVHNRSSDTRPQLAGGVLVEFTDGSSEQISIPPVGYDYLTGLYVQETYFLGLTDDRGIMSITIGTESLSQRHFWVIDNLTIAAEAPIPATLSLFGLGLAGLGWSRRKSRA